MRDGRTIAESLTEFDADTHNAGRLERAELELRKALGRWIAHIKASGTVNEIEFVPVKDPVIVRPSTGPDPCHVRSAIKAVDRCFGRKIMSSRLERQITVREDCAELRKNLNVGVKHNQIFSRTV
jgi:hypothetical protein